jgi:hypothetical protein
MFLCALIALLMIAHIVTLLGGEPGLRAPGRF